MINEDKKTCTCEVCGKIFPYKHGYRTVTCSKECDAKRKKILFTKKVIKICKNCKKEYIVKPYEKKDFCCMKCYWEYRNKNKDDYAYVGERRKEDSHEYRKCEMCGQEFKVYKKSNNRFCSNKCRAQYEHTTEFNEKRKKTMIERYGRHSNSTGWTEQQYEKYDSLREEKYKTLCDKSDLEIIGYITKHTIHVKCKKCGKDFITNNLSYLPYEKILCKHCSEEYKMCKPMSKICDILNDKNIDYEVNNRIIISPYEIDIVIPSKKIGIEINGNFWHSEICGKNNNYHINKTKMANEKGYRLIHIFEDEIEHNFEIVKSRLLSILGFFDEKIYARKCEIKIIDKKIKKDFINYNHIQGDTNSSINIGLFYNEELVSVMTFSNERVIYKKTNNNNNYELIRFCSKLNTLVIGGFSKLLTFFIKNFNPSNIKTFADIRWSNINHLLTVYEKNGFSFVKNTKPNYWYMHKSNILKRLHRYNFTKHNILSKNNNLDKNKTEWELMKELGYNRIWDCGNLRFEYKIKGE